MRDEKKLMLLAVLATIFFIALFVLYAVSGADNKFELSAWIWDQIL